MKLNHVNIRLGSIKQKPESEPNRPFVNNQESASAYPPGTPSDEGFSSAPPVDESYVPLAPSNKELIERSVEYNQQLVPLIRERIIKVREFFLTEVLPLTLAANNGLEDAKEVIRGALEEEPDAVHFTQLFDALVKDALAVKTIKFVQQFANLDEAEAALYTLKQLSSRIGTTPHGTDIEQQITTLFKNLSIKQPEEPISNPPTRRQRRKHKEL